jgi:hypothetical protein
MYGVRPMMCLLAGAIVVSPEALTDSQCSFSGLAARVGLSAPRNLVTTGELPAFVHLCTG